MRLSIRSREDFLSGLMFAAFGLTAIVVAREYPMGTAMRMGPGYFPTVLGALLILMGVVIAARALRTDDGLDRNHGFAWRPLIVLSSAFALFGVTMETLGFVPAILVLLITAVFAGREFRVFESAILIVVLLVAAVGIFIYGIQLPFRLFWWM